MYFIGKLIIRKNVPFRRTKSLTKSEEMQFKTSQLMVRFRVSHVMC